MFLRVKAEINYIRKMHIIGILFVYFVVVDYKVALNANVTTENIRECVKSCHLFLAGVWKDAGKVNVILHGNREYINYYALIL